MSVAELDALRERQMANKEKPRYDGTWRPEPGKTLPPVPEGVQPVLRFRNPIGGAVAWDDKVKGRIEISNDELDDLVIARPDGTPTYNFCVVVDDIDMAITHVIRGDDHVNNTPRQINIFRALGKEPPVYAHLPTVLNEQGEKMSKRNGAKPVTQYPRRRLPGRRDGQLPGAPGLVARRRRDLQPRAVPAVVQPRPPGPQRRAVRRGQAALGECAAHEGHGRRRARAAGRGSSCKSAASRADERLAGDLRAVQGPLRHHRGAGRLGRDVLHAGAARRRRSWPSTSTDGVRPAVGMLARDARGLPLGRGRRSPRRSRKCCAPPASRCRSWPCRCACW